jgi:hypothetical protein
MRLPEHMGYFFCAFSHPLSQHGFRMGEGEWRANQKSITWKKWLYVVLNG